MGDRNGSIPGRGRWRRQRDLARELEPTIRSIDVGIARTVPALNDRSEVREVEALNLEAISKAREVIYLENQYLASRPSSTR